MGSRNGRSSLSPRTIQVVGLGLIVGFSIFWAVTGRVEPALLVASGGLVAAGQGLQEIRKMLDEIGGAERSAGRRGRRE